MTTTEIHKIQVIANMAVSDIIRRYENNVPEELQCDEYFEYFYSYIAKRLINSLHEWNEERLERT